MISLDKILSVKNLSVSFDTYAGVVQAVRDVSFDLGKGETLAVVGESGSGKSVMSKSLMGLIPQPPGKIDGEYIRYKNENILSFGKRKLRKLRGSEISIVFQDPMTSLNPTMTIKNQIIEGILTHNRISKKKAVERAIELLGLVGIHEPEKRINQYPHQFSGGMQQRVVIAMALACDPEILIADEPTTALDVTVQAQVIDLFKKIQKERGTSIVFITHDLGVVANIADRVAVMYAGKIVEIGKVEEIFYNPRHPYTKGLLKAMPNLKDSNSRLMSIPGSPPNLMHPPAGDAFSLRNKAPLKIDFLYHPPMFKVTDTHQAATWLLHEKVDQEVEKEIENILLTGEEDEKPLSQKVLGNKLLEVMDLKQHFNAGQKNEVRAVDGVSFEIYEGETFGLVGESGCGKSTTGRNLVNLYEPTGGEVHFKGESLAKKNKVELHKQMQMIFQDPYSSLNPRWTVADIIAEGMDIHGLYKSKKERRKKVEDLLETVGLNPEHATRYPHEFSGGQRQRIGIARALAVEPEFIVADEPISALDVSIQAQVINLLKKLQEEQGLTYLFIAHDLSMVKHISDRVGVMYQGRLVEIAPSDELYENPLHPYTQSLLGAIPVPDPNSEKARKKFKDVTWEKAGVEGEMREVFPGHFVSCTEEELEMYRKKGAFELVDS